MQFRSILFGFLISGSLLLSAQDEFKIGTWRVHLPYHRCHSVVYMPPYVYGGSYSGIFSYHLQDLTLERLNKLNSLSDVGVTAMRAHRPSQSLLVGYESGIIDILKKGKVTVINDIARADFLGSKAIRIFKVYGDTVFVFTSYGASLLSLSNRAILTTIRFETSQQNIPINDVTLTSDSIYLATGAGVFTAPRTGVNLMDFSNWKRMLQLPNPYQNYNFCEFWADTLWFGKTVPGYQNDTLVLFKNGQFRTFNFPSHGADIRRIYVDMNYLHLLTNNYIFYFGRHNQLIVAQYYGGTLWQGAKDFAAVDDWVYYLADPFNGVIRKIKWSEKTDTLKPNGPDTYKAYHINIANDEVWVSAGSPGEPWNGYGIYRFKGNEWINFTSDNTQDLDSIGNISISITNPLNSKHIIAGSYGYGVIEFENDKVTKRWNIFNSPLESEENLGQGYNRITGLAFDKNRNLWIVQRYTNNPLVVKKANGEWESFNLGGLVSRQRTGEIINTPWGDMWFLVPGKGIAVFNPEKLLNNQPNAFRVFPLRRSDGNIINDVSAIAVDNDETIWVGAKTGGIFVYYNPKVALTRDILASQLIVEVDDRVEYLFGNESITDITVDGGNRKWIATAGGGVYLINRGGSKQILNLNTQNSPLLSNEVYSVDINRKTGEVFFATSLGVVSYVGSATEGNKTLTQIDIYPNPVREDYNSSVIIRGLMEDTTVKITDLSGRLVYETYSNGGTGIWNLRDFDGKRVPTGVYLIYCASPNADYSYPVKLLVATR